MRVPVNGGAPTTLASGQNGPSLVAIDAANIYWVDWGPTLGPTNSSSVMTMPLSGGSPVALASAQPFPSALAVDEASVYWFNSTDGTLVKVPKTGGAVVTLASGGETNVGGGIALTATSVYWTTGNAVMMVTPK